MLLHQVWSLEARHISDPLTAVASGLLLCRDTCQLIAMLALTRNVEGLLRNLQGRTTDKLMAHLEEYGSLGHLGPLPLPSSDVGVAVAAVGAVAVTADAAVATTANPTAQSVGVEAALGGSPFCGGMGSDEAVQRWHSDGTFAVQRMHSGGRGSSLRRESTLSTTLALAKAQSDGRAAVEGHAVTAFTDYQRWMVQQQTQEQRDARQQRLQEAKQLRQVQEAEQMRQKREAEQLRLMQCTQQRQLREAERRKLQESERLRLAQEAEKLRRRLEAERAEKLQRKTEARERMRLKKQQWYSEEQQQQDLHSEQQQDPHSEQQQQDPLSEQHHRQFHSEQQQQGLQQAERPQRQLVSQQELMRQRHIGLEQEWQRHRSLWEAAPTAEQAAAAAAAKPRPLSAGQVQPRPLSAGQAQPRPVSAGQMQPRPLAPAVRPVLQQPLPPLAVFTQQQQLPYRAGVGLRQQQRPLLPRAILTQQQQLPGQGRRAGVNQMQLQPWRQEHATGSTRHNVPPTGPGSIARNTGLMLGSSLGFAGSSVGGAGRSCLVPPSASGGARGGAARELAVSSVSCTRFLAMVTGWSGNNRREPFLGCFFGSFLGDDASSEGAFLGDASLLDDDASGTLLRNARDSPGQ